MSESSLSKTVVLDLYRPTAIATALDGFASIGTSEIEQYREQGFLAVNNAFDANTVRKAGMAIQRLVDGQVPGFSNIQFEASVNDRLAELTSEQRLDAVRKLMYFAQFEPELMSIAEDAQLARVVSQILDDAPALFQDMALLKPPSIGGEKPWHQDLAYFNLPIEARVVGVWIALDPVTPENGCMHVIPGGHRLGPRAHFKRRDWQICDTAIESTQCVAVPLQPGGCLLFDGLLPHGTPPNRTPLRRRALQFHYKGKGQAGATEEERLAVFGGEGRGVEC